MEQTTYNFFPQKIKQPCIYLETAYLVETENFLLKIL